MEFLDPEHSSHYKPPFWLGDATLFDAAKRLRRMKSQANQPPFLKNWVRKILFQILWHSHKLSCYEPTSGLIVSHSTAIPDNRLRL